MKMRENAGVIIPISAEISVVNTTNATAVFAPRRRLIANERTLFLLPDGANSSFGSNIRQMPVNDLSKVSIETV